MTEALSLVQISKQFGAVHVNKDVSITLQPGERRALIGPNGAGKTTLINMAAGTLQPTSGQIMLGGRDVTKLAVHRRARRGLARTFQITNLLPSMTVAQNLALAAQVGSVRRFDPIRPWSTSKGVWAHVDELLEKGGLKDLRDIPVGELPYGQQRRLEIVVSVAQPCSVILLDEPGAGLSSEETEELLSLVFGLDPMMAVMFIDHDVELAFRLATQVTVLHLGAVVAEGTPSEVRALPILDEIYLGAGGHA